MAMLQEQVPRIIPAEELTLPADSGWRRLPWIGLGVGLLGIVLSVALGRSQPEQFYYSWLVSFLFFLSLGLGGLFFVLVHFVTKSGWGIVLRRLAENVLATLPLLLLLFLPVYFGLESLFHWTDAEAVAHDHLLQAKQGFLNSGFFLVRAAIYFVCWVGLGLWYLRASLRQDRTGDEGITRRLTAASGPAIIVFALTLTFAAFDWAMSLDPHWYSTIFGVYFFSGSLVAIFAFLTLVAAGLRRSGTLEGVISTEHFHDLGKLLFAFTVFWTYIAFSQFFLIWYGNIPEETLWYLHRLEGGWKPVTIALAVGHFPVPFLFLMSRHVKRRTGLLVSAALWMLLMHLLDIHWLVMPTLHQHDVHPSLLDLTTVLAVGGLFVAVVGWMMGRHALVPLRDPRLVESVSFENF